MRKSKKLEILYECVRLNGKFLSTQVLKNYNLNGGDISNLKKKGYLESISWGEYSFIDLDKVFEDEQKLEVFVLEEKSLDVEEQLIDLIQNSNFKSALSLLYNFIQYGNEERVKDFKIYFLLLSQLVDFSVDELLLLRSLNKESILVEDDSENDIKNNIRCIIWRCDFNRLKNELCKIDTDNKKVKLISIMLDKILEIQKLLYAKIDAEIKNKKYDELVTFLKNRQRLRRNNFLLYKVYYIASMYLKIQETGNIPKKQTVKYPHNVFSHIDANEFEQALSLVREDGILKAILVDICNLIKSKKEEKTFNNDLNAPINDFSGSMLLRGASACLKMYASKEENKDFEFLMDGLIKLMEVGSDLSVGLFVETIEDLDEGHFDFGKFVKSFYESIDTFRFDLAKIYIQIIQGANLAFKKGLCLNGLEQVLKLKEQQYTSLMEYKKQEQNQKQSSKHLVDSIYEQLLESQKIKVVREKNVDIASLCMDDYPLMSYFKVEVDGELLIVFKFIMTENDYNYKFLRKLMEDYYANENYESCLDTCFEIIKNSTQISTEIFGRIGLCFGKTRRYEEALEYLSIAQGLAQERNEHLDYSALIMRYKEKINSQKEKRFI